MKNLTNIGNSSLTLIIQKGGKDAQNWQSWCFSLPKKSLNLNLNLNATNQDTFYKPYHI
jgi:hypothetical protein